VVYGRRRSQDGDIYMPSWLTNLRVVGGEDMRERHCNPTWAFDSDQACKLPSPHTFLGNMNVKLNVL